MSGRRKAGGRAVSSSVVRHTTEERSDARRAFSANLARFQNEVVGVENFNRLRGMSLFADADTPQKRQKRKLVDDALMSAVYFPEYATDFVDIVSRVLVLNVDALTENAALVNKQFVQRVDDALEEFVAEQSTLFPELSGFYEDKKYEFLASLRQRAVFKNPTELMTYIVDNRLQSSSRPCLIL